MPRRKRSLPLASTQRRFGVSYFANESAHVLAQGEMIELSDLPIRLQSSRPASIGAPELCLTELERQAIAEALRRTDYCKAKASRMLGINIQRLNRRIERLNISTRQG